MSDPTPDEIERVRSFEKRQREESWQRTMAESAAKIAAHEKRITSALVGQTIAGVEVDAFDADGDVRGDRAVTLRFVSGRSLAISDQGWDERYWTVNVSEGGSGDA